MRHVASGKSIEVSPTYTNIKHMSADERANSQSLTHLGQENCVNLRAVLEPRQNPHALHLPRTTVNVQLPKALRVRLRLLKLIYFKSITNFCAKTHLERVHIIREHDDLVAAVLVVLDEELARLELVWVHTVQQHALAVLDPQILPVELGGHRTPYFRTLYAMGQI